MEDDNLSHSAIDEFLPDFESDFHKFFGNPIAKVEEELMEFLRKRSEITDGN